MRVELFNFPSENMSKSPKSPTYQMWNEYIFFFEKHTFENQCLLYINKTIYVIYLTHSTTKQDNLSYTSKTIYYIKIRKGHALYMPAGAFYFPKNSVGVFGAPAGAFIFLKKRISVLNMPPGTSQSASRTSQS